MPMPTLSVPKFPDVPNVPGVPALIRKAAPVLDAIGYISHISNVIDRLTNDPVSQVWGVFDETGTDVLTPDSFLGIDYRNGSRLVDYPLEEGAFETYNKVANPFDASIGMVKGGSLAEREAFLATCEMLVKSLDFYSIVTPEVAYDSVNLERFDYRREQRNGANLIVVNLYFREIRVNAIINGQAPTKTPSSVRPKTTGQVSPNPITAAQTAAMNGAAKVLSSVKNAAKGVLSGITGAASSALSGITTK